MKAHYNSNSIVCKSRSAEYNYLASYYETGNEVEKKLAAFCHALRVDYMHLSSYYGVLAEDQNVRLNIDIICERLAKNHYGLARQFEEIGKNSSEKEYWNVLAANQRSISSAHKNYAEAIAKRKVTDIQI